MRKLYQTKKWPYLLKADFNLFQKNDHKNFPKNFLLKLHRKNEDTIKKSIYYYHRYFNPLIVKSLLLE